MRVNRGRVFVIYRGEFPKKQNPLFVGGQVVKHHDHNLFVRNAVLMDDLVGMACIGLDADRKTHTTTFKSAVTSYLLY